MSSLLGWLRGHRVAAVAAAVAALAAGALAAGAIAGRQPTPPPKPLAVAVRDALSARPVDGVTARIRFTNRLVSSADLPEGLTTPLLAGARGRAWLAADGRFRIELQSRNGDVQVVFDGHSVRAYDGTSNTLYTLALPPQRAGRDRTSGRERQRPPTLAEISRAFARLSGAAHVSGARPASVADRPAYEVTLSPRRDGGLLGPVSLAWDAIRGVPLRVVLRARGSDRPVLALEATEVSYAAVPPSVLRASNPPGARHERLALPAVGAGAAEPAPPLTGRRQAAARLGFPLAAPARLAGRQRHAVRLLPHRSGALVLYGRGLDGIAVLETPASAAWDRELTRLPAVSVGGVRAHQLTTALGSVIAWRSGGVRYTLAASMRAAAAQAAARQLSATATR